MPGGKPVPGSFMIDTGWRSALTFTSRFVARQGLLASFPKTIEATTGMGVGGPTNDTVVRVPRLQLGSYRIEDLVADFSKAKARALSQDDFSGIIGAEILRRFKVILDYPRNRLILEPNSAFSTPYVFDQSGMFVIKDSEHPTGFNIYSVVKDSPATEAGLLAGDLIEEIDNRPASKFTLEQVRQIFRGSEGYRHLLSVRRGGGVLKIRLTLRRLI